MGVKLRFHEEQFELDMTRPVNESRQLSACRDELAQVRVRGVPVGHATAQRVMEHFLAVYLRAGTRALEEGVSPHIDALVTLRSEVDGRYQRIMSLFAPGAPPLRRLPDELQVDTLLRLMRELDRRMDDLEANAARRGVRDLWAQKREPQSLEDLVAEVERRRGEPEPSGPDPTIDLDVPDKPPRQAPYESGAVHRARRREQVAENLAVRRDVLAQARRMVEDKLFPEDTVVSLQLTQASSEGLEAQLIRFRDVDPTFLGRGYEVKVKLGNGITFRADGIRFISERKYQFLESKEPYTWTEHSLYASPKGQKDLRAMLERDAIIANQLHGYGCQGFHYETGHAKLDEFLAQEIADLRAHGTPGAKLLSAPGL